MKIHANEAHPAYHPEIHRQAKILFNGAPVNNVLSADEAAGEIVRLTGEQHNGYTLTETLVGRVQICLPDELGHLRYSFMPTLGYSRAVRP